MNGANPMAAMITMRLALPAERELSNCSPRLARKLWLTRRATRTSCLTLFQVLLVPSRSIAQVKQLLRRRRKRKRRSANAEHDNFGWKINLELTSSNAKSKIRERKGVILVNVLNF